MSSRVSPDPAFSAGVLHSIWVRAEGESRANSAPSEGCCPGTQTKMDTLEWTLTGVSNGEAGELASRGLSAPRRPSMLPPLCPPLCPSLCHSKSSGLHLPLCVYQSDDSARIKETLRCVFCVSRDGSVIIRPLVPRQQKFLLKTCSRTFGYFIGFIFLPPYTIPISSNPPH